MAGIEEYLDKIKNAVYGREVRQAIHDGIKECYADGKAGSIDLIARQQIAELVAPSGEAPSAAEVTDARIGADGVTYTSLGVANRTQFTDLKEDLERQYAAVKYDWLSYQDATNAPHGWRTRYWKASDGTIAGATNAGYYICTYGITSQPLNRGLTIEGATRLKISAPAGYTIQAVEYNADGTFAGNSYGSLDPSQAITNPLNIAFEAGHKFNFSIARFENGDSADYVTNEDFINSIELIFYVPIRDKFQEVKENFFTHLYNSEQSKFSSLSAGGINTFRGADNGSRLNPYRLRTGYIPFSEDLYVTFGLTGYKWFAWVYSAASESSGTHSCTGYAILPSDEPIRIVHNEGDAYYRMCFLKEDGSAISAEGDALAIINALNIKKAANTDTNTDTDTLDVVADGLLHRISDLATRLSAIDDTLPSYYEDYIGGKIETINSLGENLTGEQFIFITDVHYNGYTEASHGAGHYGNQKHSKALMTEILHNTAISKVFNGGDNYNIDGVGSAFTGDRTYCLEELRKSTSYIIPDAYCEYYFVMGNHDGGTDYASGVQYGPWLDAEDIYYNCGMPMMATFVHRNPDNLMEYYVDNEEQKIRYIVSAGWLENLGTGKNAVVSYLWLASCLNSMKEGWVAVVYTHMGASISGTTASISTWGNRVLDIMDNYNSRTASYTYQDVPFSFSDGKGKAIALFSGHVHMDADFTSNGGIPMIVTTTDNMSGEKVLTRTKQTTTEQAFDVVTVDTTNKTITCTRIGAGTDRVFSYN